MKNYNKTMLLSILAIITYQISGMDDAFMCKVAIPRREISNAQIQPTIPQPIIEQSPSTPISNVDLSPEPAAEEVQQKRDAELIVAVINGNVHDTLSWLEKDANPNAVDVTEGPRGNVETPIIRYAINHASDKPEILQALIAYNADFTSLYEIATPSGRLQLRTPLHDACGMTGNDKAVQILLDAGASCNAVNFIGHTPLAIAAAAKRKSSIIELIKHRANINTLNPNLNTPLSMACWWVPFEQRLLVPTIETIKYLVFEKADIHIIPEKIKDWYPLPSYHSFKGIYRNLGFEIDEPTYEHLRNFSSQLHTIIAHGLTDTDVEQCERLSDQARHSILGRSHLNPQKGNLFLQIQARESGKKFPRVLRASTENQTAPKPSEDSGDRKDN